MPTQPDGYAHNGTTQLAYDDLGGAGGQPLLLVMGAAVTRFWWPAGFVSQLIDRGFHVARFDNRDSGQSTRFPMRNRGPIASVLRPNSPAYRFEDMTDDVVSVLDALGWDSAHLFGHSLGGLIVQRTAIHHPDRVRSIASSAAVPSDGKARHMLRYIRPGLIAKLTRLRFPDTPDGDVAFAMEISRLLASPGYPFDEEEARERVSQDAYCPVRDQAIMGRQLGAPWGGGRLKQIQAPATILHGKADQLLRTSAARDLAAAIDGAELHTYPGVGHDLPKEMWPVYAERVRKNADRVTSGSLCGGTAHRSSVCAYDSAAPIRYDAAVAAGGQLASAQSRVARYRDTYEIDDRGGHHHGHRGGKQHNPIRGLPLKKRALICIDLSRHT